MKNIKQYFDSGVFNILDKALHSTANHRGWFYCVHATRWNFN